MFEVVGDTIGQAFFEMRPDKLIGIKFRRVSREVKGLNSRSASKDLLDEFGSVKRASVPKKDDRAWEVAPEMTEKLPDLFGSDVLVGIEARVEPKTFSFGRDGDGRDRRNFCPASSDNEDGCFAFNRPGLLKVRNEGESALIQEYQAGSKPFGLFLYEAKRAASSSGWLLPGALWPSSVVSDSSNPSAPSNSKDLKRNNSLGNFCAPLVRYVSGSKDPSSSRLPRGLSPRGAPGFSSAFPTEAEGVPYSAAPSSQTALSSGRLDTNAPPSLTKRSVSRRPSDKYGLVSKAGRLDAVFSRLFGVCHEAS